MNKKFELPDGSNSVSDNSRLFWIYLKKHGEKTDNTSIIIYVNKTENRITFKTKTICYLDLLMPKTIKLYGSTKSKITKDKNGKNVPHLEITEVVLIHYSIVNHNYH